VLILAIVCLMPTSGITAGETQHISTRTTGAALDGGKSYLITFPKIWPAPNELPMSSALVVRVHGKDLKQVVLQSADGTSLRKLDRIQLASGGSAEFVIPTEYLHTEHGKKVKNGLWLNGDAPFTVTTFVRWNGNGESSLHLPVQSLDTSYTVSSWFVDRYGSQGSELRPGQIIVSAVEDGTVVSITPTVDIPAGPDIQAISSGQTGICTLNAGESILILPAIQPLLVKEFLSDISGTHISANKKIAVISGHTKASVPRYPDLLPANGPDAGPASFVRAPFHETQLPDGMADTLFVTIPIAYSVKRITGTANPEFGIDDDRGDVVRILALHDSTMVYKCRQDGNGFIAVRRLNRGESHIEMTQETATTWRTTKPAHVTQYGKSWFNGGELSGEQTSMRANGYPTMTSVPPVSRWTQYARIESDTSGMDCFVGLVFPTSELINLRVNGNPLAATFGSMLRTIACGSFSYVRTQITSGLTIEGRSGARFMAWTWGSRDSAGVEGRSYASTAGLSFDAECPGTTEVSHEMSSCGVFRVTVQSDTNECSRRKSIDVRGSARTTIIEESPTRVVLEITPESYDSNQIISVDVEALTGSVTTARYSFLADNIVASPRVVGLAGLPALGIRCIDVTLTNARLTGISPTTVTRLELAHNELVNPPSFGEITSSEKKTAEVCVRRTTEKLVDTLFVVTDCRRIPVMFFDFTLTSIDEDAVAGLEILDVRPLPATDGEVLVNVTSRDAVLTQFEVTNMLGQNVTYAVGGALCPLQPGINTVHLNVASLSPGTYFVGVAGRPSTVLVVR